MHDCSSHLRSEDECCASGTIAAGNDEEMIVISCYKVNKLEKLISRSKYSLSQSSL